MWRVFLNATCIFYLFYNQEDKILHRVGAELGGENLHQVGTKKKDYKIRHQVGDIFCSKDDKKRLEPRDADEWSEFLTSAEIKLSSD